jgi:large repetitive protein
LSGATEVDFNGIPAIFTVVSDSHIATSVPHGALTGPITVTTPGGSDASEVAFKVKPKVKRFTPTSGPVGTLVTITGTAFTGATRVQFNGVNAAYTVDSYTQITATVPASATTGFITVVTPGGKGKSKTVFTVA